MSYALNPLVNRLVVFAQTADEPCLQALRELESRGLLVSLVSDVIQGLHLLNQLPAEACAKTVCLITGPMEKLSVLTVANAIRSLPTCAATPLVVFEPLPQHLNRCQRCDPPLHADHIYQLLTTDPSAWVNLQPLRAREVASGPAPEVILLVDDSPVNLRMLRYLIEAFGFTVDTCEDGEQALARIAAGGVRLVFMDCHMPIMDGYEATTIIRQKEADSNRHLPIVAVTANAMLSNRERCFSIGMDDFLIKPVSNDRLRDIIAQWLP